MPPRRARRARLRLRRTLRGRPTGRPRGGRDPLPARAEGTTRPPSAAAARALATATPYSSIGCSSARPHTTRTFGSSAAQRSRKRHFRRSASSSVTGRSGSMTARGMPGVPPPEPTSTIGPSSPATTARPRSASSSRARRASARSRMAVRPGVSSRSASHASSRSSLGVAAAIRALGGSRQSAGRGGHDDDTAVRLGALARRLDFGIVLQQLVHDLALDGGHRVEHDPAPDGDRALGAAPGDRLERRRATGAIAGGVDDDRPAGLAEGAVADGVGEVLERVDRLPVPADENAEVGADELGVHLVAGVVDAEPWRRRRSQRPPARAAPAPGRPGPALPRAAGRAPELVALGRAKLRLLPWRSLGRGCSRRRGARARPRSRPGSGRPHGRSRARGARARGRPPTSPRRRSRRSPRR